MSNELTGNSSNSAGGQVSAAGVRPQLTIDIGAAASGLETFSVNVLARLSQAGIDTLTFAVTVIVGGQVAWSQVGSERFYEALERA